MCVLFLGKGFKFLYAFSDFFFPIQTMDTILEWTANVCLLFISKLSQQFDGRQDFHVVTQLLC